MTEFFHAIVEDIQDPHPDIRIIRLRLPEPRVTWLAGQFMEIAFHGFPARAYSIANTAHDAFMEFHIRNNNRGGASQHAVTALKIGDTLTLRGPFGHATLQADDKSPLAFIAGGMGISPIKAVIEDLIRQHKPVQVTLYWGGKTASDLYLQSHFHSLQQANSAFRFVPVIEDRGDGLVDAAALKDIADPSGTRFYISGPADMVNAVIPALLKQGAQPTKIYTDDVLANTLLKTGTGPS